MFTKEFIPDFDDFQTLDVNLAKIKRQLIEELMYRKKERLRALLEMLNLKKCLA